MADIDLGEIGNDVIDLSAPKKQPVLTTGKQLYEEDLKKNTSGFGRFMGGLGYGMLQTGRQAATLLPFTDKNALRQSMAEDAEIFESMRNVDKDSWITPAGAGNFIGQVAATAPLMMIPGGQATLPARMAAGAAVGTMGGALLPAQSGKETLQNALMGTAMGGAFPAAEKYIVSPLFKKAVDMTRPVTTSSIVQRGMTEGIKPSFTVQQTVPQRKEYFKKAEEAVSEIIGNKENLRYIDDLGDEVVGKLPKTVKQFSEALDQTKRSLFTKYNDMTMEATGKGIEIPVDKAIATLRKEASKKVNQANPNFVSAAEEAIGILENAQFYNPVEAQELISRFNQTLQMYYNNPSKQTQGAAAVDALIAGSLRESLENTLEKGGFQGYQELKNRYGALKTIEKDVNRRTAVHSRKAPAGLFDITDTYSAQHAAMALMKADPVGLLAAGTAKGVKDYLKWLSNPDRSVRRMFGDAERKLGQRPKPVQKQTQEGPQKMLPPGQGFTMKPYYPDEVIPPPSGPPVVPQERRLAGPTVEGGIANSGLLPSPKAPGVIEAGYTPSLQTGKSGKGAFYMEGPQGRIDINVREARQKLRDIGYSSDEIESFLVQMMRSGR